MEGISLTITNSFVYVYGKDIVKYAKELASILGTGSYSIPGSTRDKILFYVKGGERVITKPSEIIEFQNDFKEMIDEMILGAIDEYGIPIESYNVSNIIFSGNALYGLRMPDPVEISRYILIQLYNDKEVTREDLFKLFVEANNENIKEHLDVVNRIINDILFEVSILKRSNYIKNIKEKNNFEKILESIHRRRITNRIISILDMHTGVDLNMLKDVILQKYGDRIYYIEKPQVKGSNFAGLIVKILCDPTLRTPRGKVKLKGHTTVMILFSTRRFTLTYVTEETAPIVFDITQEMKKLSDKKPDIFSIPYF